MLLFVCYAAPALAADDVVVIAAVIIIVSSVTNADRDNDCDRGKGEMSQMEPG